MKGFDGLSSGLGLTQSSDFSCPQVVGMLNGTGLRIQSISLKSIPSTRIVAAA